MRIQIIDKYILKKYILTVFSLILMFIPVGIMVDLSEKIDRIIQSELTRDQIFLYYLGFAGYFGDLLFPIFLFISIIWFTSKLSNNSEIIAILSSGISFQRFLRPYFIGAFILGIFILVMNMFIIPKANKIYKDITHTYLYKTSKTIDTDQIFNQINENEYVYVSFYRPSEKKGYNFSLEHFENNQMTFKILAEKVEWKDTIFTLTDYSKRIITPLEDRIITKDVFDTLLPFKIDDLAQHSYIAETKNFFELNKFIKKEKIRGSPNLNRYLLVAYKRWVIPITVLNLTLIAVSVSSTRRRGGIGLNLSFGSAIAFTYIFLDKIFSVLVLNSNFSPLFAIGIPVLIFSTIAIILINRARR